MIDLKTVLREHPDCISSRTLFRSVLMDIYPNEKRKVNILTSMLECGIVQKIKNRKILNNNEVQAILGQLENEYGTAAIYASNGIKIWADAFGVSVQVTSVQTSQSVIVPEPIIHAPIVETAVVEGTQSDYETKLKKGFLTITKFLGFDEDEIIIPNSIGGVSVKTIGKGAFSKCKGIKKVIISEGITVIQGGAFKECTSLKEVVLPSTLQKIGDSVDNEDGAFSECAIETIQLPIGLRFIGSSTFAHCKKLGEINLPNSVRSLGENAFSFTGLTKVDIPASVKRIESSTFYACDHLSNVSLHEGLDAIGNCAFEFCDMLHSITIPKSVSFLGVRTFRPNVVISCYAGSYALDYARENGYQIQNAAKQCKP